MNQKILSLVALGSILLVAYNNCGQGIEAQNQDGIELVGTFFRPDAEQEYVVMSPDSVVESSSVALSDSDGDGFGDPDSVVINGSGRPELMGARDRVRAYNCVVAFSNDQNIVIHLPNQPSAEACGLVANQVSIELDQKVCANFNPAPVLTLVYNEVIVRTWTPNCSGSSGDIR